MEQKVQRFPVFVLPHSPTYIGYLKIVQVFVYCTFHNELQNFNSMAGTQVAIVNNEEEDTMMK